MYPVDIFQRNRFVCVGSEEQYTFPEQWGILPVCHKQLQFGAPRRYRLVLPSAGLPTKLNVNR